MSTFKFIYADQNGDPAELSDAGRAPCCPFGSDPQSWGPAAAGLARLYAESDGRRLPTFEELEGAIGAVVNMGDHEAADLHASYPEHVPCPRPI